ncbi:MAG: hypothetical protein DSM106950_15610 [Stigonema ocellatum SAG 48.90 = DSM 106950]|nr:hypothetical protein [Stigonema ocellatum SAG 48.90 = DSM 106950]
MNHGITRRKFGQLIIAGTAVTGISTFASRLNALTVPTLKSPILAGVSLSRQASSPTTVTSQVVVQTLALKTGQVQQQMNIQVQSPTNSLVSATQTLRPYDQLGGFTSTADGTLILSTNPTGSRQQANPSRLTTIVGSSSQTMNVSGLAPEDALWSLLATNDGSLIGLVARTNGRSPYRLANIDIHTGKLNFINFHLPTNEWFSNLTQCPNGNIYAVSAGFRGGTSLVQLDLRSRRLIRLPRFSLNGVNWRNGFNSLVCSGDGQFYALGNPNKYGIKGALYSVDLSTGALTKQIEFLDYQKITLARQSVGRT